MASQSHTPKKLKLELSGSKSTHPVPLGSESSLSSFLAGKESVSWVFLVDSCNEAAVDPVYHTETYVWEMIYDVVRETVVCDQVVAPDSCLCYEDEEEEEEEEDSLLQDCCYHYLASCTAFFQQVEVA